MQDTRAKRGGGYLALGGNEYQRKAPRAPRHRLMALPVQTSSPHSTYRQRVVTGENGTTMIARSICCFCTPLPLARCPPVSGLLMSRHQWAYHPVTLSIHTATIRCELLPPSRCAPHTRPFGPIILEVGFVHQIQLDGRKVTVVGHKPCEPPILCASNTSISASKLQDTVFWNHAIIAYEPPTEDPTHRICDALPLVTRSMRRSNSMQLIEPGLPSQPRRRALVFVGIGVPLLLLLFFAGRFAFEGWGQSSSVFGSGR